MMFAPSQLSPMSMAELPHFGLSVQLAVSSWQVEEHFSVPPINELLYPVQFFILAKLVPSHDSPMFTVPSPQVPCRPWHHEVSSLQALHVRLPPVNVDGL